MVAGRAKAWEEKDFSYDITGKANQASVENHTYDVAEKNEGKMTATTLNSARNKACGANKKKLSLVFMHSDVATNFENLNLVAHLKYTDKDGIQRKVFAPFGISYEKKSQNMLSPTDAELK